MNIHGKDVCETNFGAHAQPISIHSAAENNFIQKELLKRSLHPVWIGLHTDQRQLSLWKWWDRTAVDFSKWSEKNSAVHDK